VWTDEQIFQRELIFVNVVDEGALDTDDNTPRAAAIYSSQIDEIFRIRSTHTLYDQHRSYKQTIRNRTPHWWNRYTCKAMLVNTIRVP